MNVHVKLFAVAKELAARDELTVDLLPGATIADLRAKVASQFPVLNKVLLHALWAVDAQYADNTTTLNDQSDVALIPPVSGG